MNLEEAVKSITKADEKILHLSRRKWDSIAKPLRSLGLLEENIIKIAGALNNVDVNIEKKALITMCADNGIVEENVTQTGQEITALVTENFTKEKATVSIMCKMAHVDLFPIDIGVYRDIDDYLDESSGLKPFKVINRKIAYGTKNFAHGQAMSEEETIRAIETGIELVKDLKDMGYTLIATGEMGIGNTSTSSAFASVLLDLPVEEVTGKGAGLSDEGLIHKIDVIKKGIEVNNPNKDEMIDVLSTVGGLDIAGLTGIFLGGAVYNIPVMIDGFISAVAALLAVRMNENIKDYIIPSHVSKEPAGRILLDALGLKPLLTCEMCLGEGSGAVSAIPLLDMASKVYKDMSTFGEFGFEYKPL